MEKEGEDWEKIRTEDSLLSDRQAMSTRSCYCLVRYYLSEIYLSRITTTTTGRELLEEKMFFLFFGKHLLLLPDSCLFPGLLAEVVFINTKHGDQISSLGCLSHIFTIYEAKSSFFTGSESVQGTLFLFSLHSRFKS